MTGTVKVYEIAEDLKLDTEIVLQKIQALGISAKNKMSKVDAGLVDQIKSALAKDRQASYVEIEVAPGVKVRRPVKPAAPPPKPATLTMTDVTARPVIAQQARPATEKAPEPPPVVVEKAPEPAPVVVEKAPEPPPVVVEKAPEPPPVVVEKAPEPAPVVVEKAPEPAPVVVEKAPEPAPVVVVEKAPEPAPVVVEKAPAEKPATGKKTEPKSGKKTADKPATEKAPEPPPVVVEKAPEPPPVVVEKTPEPAPVVVGEKAPEPPPVVVEKAPEPVAVVEARQAVLPPPPRPPTDMPKTADVVQASRPSQPPPKPNEPKKGIAVWDPVKKEVTWIPTAAPPAPRPPRRVEVTPAPPSRNSRPIGRPGPSGPSRPTQFQPRQAPNPSAQPSTVDPKRKPVIKIEQQISLQELSRRMNIRATEVLMKLLQVGGAGKNINSTLDADTATLLAGEFGFTVEDVALDTMAIIKKALPPDTIQDSSPRSPVVTVMGHVDHGKTTLLDAILGMRVADGEAGGITQEVRAYRVITAKGPVVFFDTPGHAAFTELRSRGAQATDVAVLVVAADDGVMPTTIEAINHVKAAKVPIVVALNKMDKPDANPERVIRQLMEYGVVPSEYGGDTMMVKVSAKSKTGIEELLETLAFQTEYLGLKANAKKAGVGTVFESKLDKGRGAVARVLVQEGIIRNGDVVLVGSAWGRIRAMFDDRGKSIDKAGPSTPVEILGLSEPPNAGDKIYVCVDARKAQEAAEQIKAAVKKGPGQRGPIDIHEIVRAGQNEKVTIHAVIKADAQGAVEGLKKALTELSTDKVEVKVLHAAVGAITETDVQLAVSARAVIIGFNVRPAGKAAAVAEEQKIGMRFYNVIYEAVDDIKLLMVGQLKPTLVEKALGKAEVRQVFNITKVGIIAGCMVVDGLVRRGAQMRLVRDGAKVWEGKIGTLRRIKEDVAEVKQGFECGIGLDNTPAIKAGDIIEAFEIEEVAARL
jgi:translation initiation factor IF-2